MIFVRAFVPLTVHKFVHSILLLSFYRTLLQQFKLKFTGLKITPTSLSLKKEAFEGADQHSTINQMKSVFCKAQALM